jgi:hypothetical protein
MKIFKAVLLLTSIFYIGCGVKGSPKPPNEKESINFLIEDVKQQGNLVVFYWKTNKKLNIQNTKVILNDKILNTSIYHLDNFYWIDYKFTDFNKEYCFFVKTTIANDVYNSQIRCIKPQKYTIIHDKVKLILKNDGILLKWNEKYQNVNIYRGNSYIEILPIPYKQIKNENNYFDKDVSLNKVYCYYITTTINNIETNRIYSECIKFEDIYPPHPPSNLTYLIKDNNLTIIWEPPSDNDVIGYLIYKNGKLLTNFLIKGYYFIDNHFKKGDVYAIYSVDKASNKSKPAYLKVE